MTSNTLKKPYFFLKKDIIIILFTTLLSNIGSFMIVPFLSIYLTSLQTISIADAGIIIGISVWFKQAGTLAGGFLADMTSNRVSMLLGLAVRIPGYIGLAYSENFFLLVCACIAISIGSGLYLPSAKSELVSKVSDSNKVQALSIRTMLSNTGVAMGPVIGLLAFTLSPIVLFVSVSLIFLLLLIANVFIKPEQASVIALKARKLSIVELLLNKDMITCSIIMFVFMALYIQLEVTIPLMAKAYLGKIGATVIFLLNSITVIMLQLPISRKACSMNKNKAFMIGGFVIFCSFMFFSKMYSPWLFLSVGIILFTLGEIIISIRLDYETTNINRHMVATSFGILSFFGAFGAFFGSYLGAKLYALYAINKSAEFWYLLALFTVLFTLFFSSLLFINKQREQHA